MTIYFDGFEFVVTMGQVLHASFKTLQEAQAAYPFARFVAI